MNINKVTFIGKINRPKCTLFLHVIVADLLSIGSRFSFRNNASEVEVPKFFVLIQVNISLYGFQCFCGCETKSLVYFPFESFNV